MYSKEQLQGFTKCNSFDCLTGECEFHKFCVKEVSRGEEPISVIARQCIAEMEAKEAAERRAAVAESAVEFAIAVGVAHDTENLPQSKEYYIRLAEWDMEREKANQALKEAAPCEK